MIDPIYAGDLIFISHYVVCLLLETIKILINYFKVEAFTYD